MGVANRLLMPFFRKWVAGEKLEDAVRVVKKLNNGYDDNGHRHGIINYLGEHYEKREQVERAKKEYHDIITQIGMEGLTLPVFLNATASIKPSQMGFDVEEKEPKRNYLHRRMVDMAKNDPVLGREFMSEEVYRKAYCFNNMREIVKSAHERGVFVWVDMESKKYTDFTIGAYKSLLSEFGNVGLCLQSDIDRTDKDLEDFKELAKKGEHKPVLRLVKGIYGEEEKTKAEVNERYERHIRSAFETPELGLAVASHDDKYVDLALKLNEEKPKEFFEVQMLKGIREDYAGRIAKGGTQVSVYVPYGPDSVAYSMRRAKKMGRLIVESLFNTKLTS